jgi:CBS domain-containing protein
MSDRVRLARKTPVSASQDLLAIEPLLIPPDADLLEAMRRSARQPSTRLIGIAEPGGPVLGMLPVGVLAEAVVAHAVPEAFFADLPGVDKVGDFGHAMEARVVSEIMLPAVTIAPGATITEAFRLMHQHQLSGLYVVDGDGRCIGYLDLQELAMRYVEALDEPLDLRAPGTPSSGETSPTPEP